MPDPTTLLSLPKTDLALSRLSLGTGSIAGLYSPVSETQAHQTLEAAWSAGVRYFDTAPHYGQGLAETRLGRFLRSKTQYVVSSKVGRLLRPDLPLHPSQLSGGEPLFKDSPALGEVYDYSYPGVMLSLEETLKRLGLNAVDILYIHDPDADNRQVAEVMQGGYKALLELRQQRVVRAIGVGMNQFQMLEAFARVGDFDVMLLAGRYTLLEQGALDFLERCYHQGIGVVLGGVFNSGILANPHPQAPYNYSRASPALVERALKLQRLCDDHGVPLKAAALQFPLAHPAVVSVVSGARSAEEILENAGLMQLEIPPQLWDAFKQTGLIPAHVPTP